MGTDDKKMLTKNKGQIYKKKHWSSIIPYLSISCEPVSSEGNRENQTEISHKNVKRIFANTKGTK